MASPYTGTFPTEVVDASLVRIGAGRLAIAAATTNGAIASGAWDLGPTKGGVDYDPKITQFMIECDQRLNAIGAQPIKEEHDVKVTLLDMSLANLYKIMSQLTNPYLGGTQVRTDTAPYFALGEEVSRRYFQLTWKGPSISGLGGYRYLTLWRCVIQSRGTFKLAKEKNDEVQVTFRALTDVGAQAATGYPVGFISDQAT